MSKKHKLLPNQARFEVTVGLSLTDRVKQKEVMQWLNLQHTGKKTVPISQAVSQAHSEAGYNLFRHFPIHFIVEFDKKGNATLVNIDMGKS